MRFIRGIPLILFTTVITHSPAVAQGDLFSLYTSGAFEEVVAEVAGKIESGDATAEEYQLKSMAELQLGLSGQALRTIEEGVRAYPGDQRLARMRAEQLFELGDYPKAFKQYETLVRSDSTDMASWLKMADISFNRQQYTKAVSLLKRVLQLDSSNLTGLVMMADILQRRGDTAAVRYYRRAYEQYPVNQKVAYSLANWHVQSGDPDQAVPVCRKILEVDSTNIRFRKLLGFAFYRMGRATSSIGQFAQAAELGDSTAFTFKFKGISHYIAVQIDEAIESLRIAAGKDSLDAEIHYFLGAALGQTTQKEEAMKHLNRSLKLMKPDPAVVARIYSEQGNIRRLEMEYEKAYSLYRKAWEADTTNPLALYYMASILDNSLHRSGEALVDYRRFIDRLDRMPENEERDAQTLTLRAIVEDRIEYLNEELFFLDR